MHGLQIGKRPSTGSKMVPVRDTPPLGTWIGTDRASPGDDAAFPPRRSGNPLAHDRRGA